MRNNAGFTLLEVVLTLGLLASCMVFFLRWQGIVVGATLQDWHDFERILVIKNNLYKQMLNPKEGVEQTRDQDLHTTFVTTVKPVPNSSSLARFAPALRMVQASAQWQDATNHEKELMLLGCVPSTMVSHEK